MQTIEFKLSKSIAELEKDKIKFIWQPPNIYNDVLRNNIWLVYGRKGSGKSTLVDYLSTSNGNKKVIVIRPRENELFRKIKAAISPEAILHIDETISFIFDFVLMTNLMKETLLDAGYKIVNDNSLSIIHLFLKNHGFLSGNIYHKALKFLGTLTGGAFVIKPNLPNLYDNNCSEPNFSDAKKALYNYMDQNKINRIICIDDIDEIGFSYSPIDKVLINSLIIFMVRSNISSIEKHIGLRILITTPSELFFQSSLWGADWVSSKSRCLQWIEMEQLQGLVNKRIAIELNVTKSHPRFPDDKYSIETEHTWQKIFPASIRNKLDKSESTFQYIVRHTFYTPRQVLDLCDFILIKFDANKIPFSEIIKVDTYKSSQIIQDAVESFTYRLRRDLIDVYSKLYIGLDEVFQSFQQRPNIWYRNQLLSFVKEKTLSLISIENEKEYTNEQLVEKLQNIGFFGLGTRSIVEVVGTIKYDMRFSFLEEYPTYKSWEIAAISPLFYDSYDIRPLDNVIVIPHNKLIIPISSEHKLVNYNHQINNF
jgi:energy-coupling factor transporter ATP-binding protein EcfA2